MKGFLGLTDFDFSKLKGYVIAVNHSAKFHKADMLVTVDTVWHKKESEYFDNFKGLKYTYNETIRNDFPLSDLDT